MEKNNDSKTQNKNKKIVTVVKDGQHLLISSSIIHKLQDLAIRIAKKTGRSDALREVVYSYMTYCDGFIEARPEDFEEFCEIIGKLYE